MITPVGLKIKKKPAFQPVSEDFEFKWNFITFNAEGRIVQLLLYESENVFRKIEVKIQKKYNEKSPEKLKQRYAELEKKYFDHQSKLEQRRRKKWKKFKEIKNTLYNTKKIIAEARGRKVSGRSISYATIGN